MPLIKTTDDAPTNPVEETLSNAHASEQKNTLPASEQGVFRTSPSGQEERLTGRTWSPTSTAKPATPQLPVADFSGFKGKEVPKGMVLDQNSLATLPKGVKYVGPTTTSTPPAAQATDDYEDWAKRYKKPGEEPESPEDDASPEETPEPQPEAEEAELPRSEQAQARERMTTVTGEEPTLESLQKEGVQLGKYSKKAVPQGEIKVNQANAMNLFVDPRMKPAQVNGPGVRERLATKQMGSPTQQLKTRQQTDWESTRPGYSVDAHGRMRKGVPMNQAVEQDQQNFNTLYNARRATTPPATTLDEYDKQYQDFAASLGDAALQFQDQLHDIFFRDMPPSVRTEYNTLMEEEQANKELAIVEARTKIVEMAKRVINEDAVVGGIKPLMRDIITEKEKTKAREEGQHEEGVRYSRTGEEAEVAGRKGKTEAAAAAEKETAVSKAKEAEEAANAPAKAAREADAERQKEEAKEKALAPRRKAEAKKTRGDKEYDDAFNMMKEYRQLFNDADTDLRNATRDLYDATHDKDDTEIPGDAVKVADAKRAHEEAYKAKDAARKLLDDQRTAVEGMRKSRTESAAQEERFARFTPAQIEAWKLENPGKNPETDMTETVYDTQIRKYREAEAAKKPKK